MVSATGRLRGPAGSRRSGSLDTANSGPFGLVSSLFTTSLGKAFRFAEELDCGLTVVDDTSISWELNVPFAGSAGRCADAIRRQPDPERFARTRVDQSS